MPWPDSNPTVGLSPTTRLLPAGQTIDPSVSLPTAPAQKFNAGATAEPELDPQGSKSRRYGSRVNPPRALQPLNGAKPRKFAHSDRLALPRMTAPSFRNRPATVAWAGTLLPSSASEPAVVSMSPLNAMLSFRITGIPCSGPRMKPARLSSSRRIAVATACGFVSITAATNGFSRSIRLRYPFVSSRLVSCPVFMSHRSCGIVFSNQMGAPSTDGVAASTTEVNPPVRSAAPPAAPAPRKALRVTPSRDSACP
jgi:hypothetical protein